LTDDIKVVKKKKKREEQKMVVIRGGKYKKRTKLLWYFTRGSDVLAPSSEKGIDLILIWV
jgi:hydroxymethylpyrimidine/phosphomethylpyrimidine kinase